MQGFRDVVGVLVAILPMYSYSCLVPSISIKPTGYITPRPGAIPPSMIPIPAHLFDSDSDSNHLGYDSDSDSDSNTIFMNDSDSDSDSSTPYIMIVTPELYKF